MGSLPGAGMAEERVAEVGLRWLYLPIVLDHASCILSQFKATLLSVVRPEWNEDKLRLTVFEDGTTNKLVGFYEDGRRAEDVVLLRLNGVGTERFIDREVEITVLLALNKAGITASVYCQIENGLCYGFLHGSHVPDHKISDDRTMKRVAQSLAKLHAVPIPVSLQDRQPQIWAKCEEWLKLAPREFSDPRKNEVFKETIGSLDVLKSEIKSLKQELSHCAFPVVLCHNDLTNRNVICNEEDDSLGIIDLEYGGPNYLAFDIGNHFCEFAGIDDPDYDKYPCEAVQKVFIRAYLEESARLKGDDSVTVTDADIHSLYRECNKFALGAHLMWCLWGLLQSHVSLIEFDYLEYACLRFAEYQNRKEEFYAL